MYRERQSFPTRYKFLEEAHRTLKPGGRLAIWDFFYDENQLDVLGQVHPKEKYLPSLDAYRENVLKVGFKYVRVEDATEFSVKALHKHEVKRMKREFEKKRDYKILEEDNAEPKVRGRHHGVLGLRHQVGACSGARDSELKSAPWLASEKA